MKKILITGASGFIGRHLAQDLSARKYKVYLFDIRKKNYNIAGKFIRGDLNNLNQVMAACAGMDGIIHLAAVTRVSLAYQFPHNCIDVNVMGTVNILESIRLSKTKPWLIMGSTREVNFDWQHKRVTGDFRKIGSFYGISKFIAELLCLQYSRDYNLQILVLRFSDVYGSVYDNPEKVLPKLVFKSVNNSDISINNPTKQFDFIHYKDAVRGIYLAVRYMDKNNSYPFFKQIVLCTGSSINLRELAELIVRKANSSSGLIFMNNISPECNYRLFIDRKNAEEVLNFKTKIPLDQGIRLTIKGFKERPGKKLL